MNKFGLVLSILSFGLLLSLTFFNSHKALASGSFNVLRAQDGIIEIPLGEPCDNAINGFYIYKDDSLYGQGGPVFPNSWGYPTPPPDGVGCWLERDEYFNGTKPYPLPDGTYRIEIFTNEGPHLISNDFTVSGGTYPGTPIPTPVVTTTPTPTPTTIPTPSFDILKAQDGIIQIPLGTPCDKAMINGFYIYNEYGIYGQGGPVLPNGWGYPPPTSEYPGCWIERDEYFNGTKPYPLPNGTYHIEILVSGEAPLVSNDFTVSGGTYPGTPIPTPTQTPNHPPEPSVSSSTTIALGQTYSINGSFLDSDSTSWTATVDYGDDAGSQILSLNGDHSFSLNHQYTSAGTYTVTVAITDNQGATGTVMTTVTVNVAPQINDISNSEINYQDDFMQSGSFTDTDSTSWTATVDYGDGFGVQPLTLNPNKTFTLDHIYPATGTYNVIITITDNQGTAGAASIIVKVNAPPHINQLADATINEGQTYTDNGSFIDADSTSWTGVVNYGDGSGAETLTLNSNNTFSLSHIYKNNGTYNVIVAITDNQGAIGTKTATVTVNNIAPSVSNITASDNPVQVNTATVASATFTDEGVIDTHTAVWNWGDGTTSNATINSSSISNSHIYITAGVYQITLTVSDNDGGVTTKTYQYLSVYNPTAQGLFSAGQRFVSSTGGNVLFGLSYKYQGTVPTGTRQFSMDYNQGNIHFNASTINALIISNSVGRLTGEGTFNGSTGFTFLVVGDENTNRIRIRIKDPSGVVVYDTQPGAVDTAAPTTSVTGNIIAH